MKALQFLLKIGIFLFSTHHACAQEFSYEKASFADQKVNIIDTTGIAVGYFMVDHWDKQRVNVYDSSNHLINTIDIEALDRSDAQEWRPTREYVKNKNGAVVGYKEANIMLKNTVNLYDLEGRKIGFYKRNVWSGVWEWVEG